MDKNGVTPVTNGITTSSIASSTNDEGYDEKVEGTPTHPQSEDTLSTKEVIDEQALHASAMKLSDSPSYKMEESASFCRRFWESVLPVLKWGRNYKKDYLSFDLTAGLTVGIMAIPQGMAYAMLANLPPIYGLYCCIAPVFMYCFLGTSSQVHIGPFALISMMVASSLSFLDSTNLNEYIGAVTTLTLITGVVYVLLYICRLGFITRVLSETIVTAFTAASAFNIGGSQLKHYWGVSTQKSVFFAIIIDVFSKFSSFNWYSFGLGFSATVLLYIMKKLNKKYSPKKPLPVELFLVIVYIIIMWAFNLNERWKVKYLGDYNIQRGLPPISIPSMKYLSAIIPSSIMICIVGFAITVSLGKIFARQFSYKLDDNQELLALGGAHIVGAFFSCYPPAGSLSRTALAANCLSKTPFHNFISPIIIILCLLLLTDIIKYIPNACLAAIVLINLIPLFKQFSELPRLWRTNWADFWCFIVCTICTTVFGTEMGLIGGVVSSLVFLGIALFVSSKKKPSVEEIQVPKNVRLVKCGRYFQFLNRATIENRIEKEYQKEKNNPNVLLVLDMRQLTYIDASGIMTLQEMTSHYNTDRKILSCLQSTDYLKQMIHRYGDKTIIVNKSIDEVIMVSIDTV